jgi:hypothetical protein
LTGLREFGAGRFRRATFVLGEIMSSRRRFKIPAPIPTMHGWTARHYIISAVIILLAVGMFAYSWS